MHIKHDIKSSETFALASFQEMKKNSVSYNPVNFSVWYNYHARENPELVSRVEELLSTQDNIGEEQSAALFDEFVSGAILNRSRQISEKLEHIAEEISGNLEQTGQKSSDYVGHMETLQKNLSSADSAGDADGIVDKMLLVSRNATSEIKNLRESARQHQSEMDSLRQELESIRDESRTDQLTGIANRRQFNERLHQLSASSTKNNEPLSLVLGDIDFFKKFNDEFGHQAGDQVLRIVGEQLRQNVKGKDLAARYGGEEFALLLPNTPLSAAISVSHIVRKLIAANKIELDGAEKTITMSFGVAQLDGQESAQSLIERADKNLYASKEAGRNTVSPSLPEVEDREFEIIDVRKMG